MSGEEPKFVRVELDGDDIVGEVERQQRHEEARLRNPKTHDSSCACCCIDCDVEEAETP